MDPEGPSELVAALHACLFAAGEPITVKALCEAVQQEAPDVRAALRELQERTRRSGVVLEQIAGGWQLRTDTRFQIPVQRLLGARPMRLSRAALEVLAVVAYRQPVTRMEIEGMRGVDSGGVLKTLLDRRLVRSAGRSDDPGRPLLYRTTATFLQLFSLPDLRGLPTMEERHSLVRAQSVHTHAEE
ncbi:MAG: SMC-Scp complex subunit ScpB [Myxococcales bacterium]|nr:SMC-Scp complex subunit ScpB [Myxococcales bacterium]